MRKGGFNRIGTSGFLGRLRFIRGLSCALTFVFLLSGCGSGSSSTSDDSQAPPPIADDGNWVAAWSAAMLGPYPDGAFTPLGFELPQNPGAFTDMQAVEQTFRMVIHPTIAGNQVRACFSNLLGDRRQVLRSVKVARSVGGPAIVQASEVQLTFGGNESAGIAPRTSLCSDGVDFSYAVGEDIAISFYVPGPSGPMTWHAEAYATQYVNSPNDGDETSDSSGAAFNDNPQRSWFFLTEFDVARQNSVDFAITAFGDSITDGAFSTPGTNQRYPDFLAQRLQNASIPAGVRNMGINGNFATNTVSGGVNGQAAVNRVLSDAPGPGVKSVFLLAGTNDLAFGVPVDDIFNALVTFSQRARAAGLCVVIGTVMPRNDPVGLFGWDATVDEPRRQDLNTRILASDQFDAVADIAAVMATPGAPSVPNPVLFVDGVHPNSAGMQVLADAIPLEPLMPPPFGSCNR